MHSKIAGTAIVPMAELRTMLEEIVAGNGSTNNAAEPVWIKQAPVSYRVLLAAVNAGELPAFRVGARSCVRRGDLNEWICSERHRLHKGEAAPELVQVEEPDELDQLISANNNRRRAGSRG